VPPSVVHCAQVHDVLKHVSSAVQRWKKLEILPPVSQAFLLDRVEHVDPDERQGNEQAGEEAGDDVENHERGQARHCEMLHCVEAEEADSDEEKSTVDLFKS